MKSARIYAELAEFARGRGYPAATEHAAKDWRGRGMVPSSRGLGRRRRRPGRIPLELRQRVLRICYYHYTLGIRDLRIVTLLLWLEGEEIDLAVVRSALATIRALPERLVKLTGHSAQRAEPKATDADIDATADAVGRVLSTLPEARYLSRDDLVNAAADALRMAMDRGMPERDEDLASLATAIGLDRAHQDLLEEVGPWLDTNPAVAFGQALVGLYGPGAGNLIAQTTDEELLRAREVANQVIKIFGTFAAISFGFPPGTAGLDLMSQLATQPEFKPLILYVAALVPAGAEELANAFTDEDLARWQADANLGRAWLEANPEHRADVATRGLVAVLRDFGF